MRGHLTFLSFHYLEIRERGRKWLSFNITTNVIFTLPSGKTYLPDPSLFTAHSLL